MTVNICSPFLHNSQLFSSNMGSCISRFKPNKESKQDFSHVDDKLVILQDPIPPKTLKHHLSPPISSSASAPSCSFFSSSVNGKLSSCESFSKDQSFSDELLWACLKDNTQINGQRRDEEQLGNGGELHCHSNIKLPSMLASQSFPEKDVIRGVTPKKRDRPGSPMLARQESFRRDQIAMINKGLRSPSPHRRVPRITTSRLYGENSSSQISKPADNEDPSRRLTVSKGNATNSSASRLQRENFRASIASPARDLAMNRKKNTLSQEITSRKIDTHVSTHERDFAMEDINNPIIALDCFIFL